MICMYPQYGSKCRLAAYWTIIHELSEAISKGEKFYAMENGLSADIGIQCRARPDRLKISLKNSENWCLSESFGDN